MFCPECGAPLNDNHKFCPRCGMKLDISDDTSTFSPEQTQQADGPARRQASQKPKTWLVIAACALVAALVGGGVSVLVTTHATQSKNVTQDEGSATTKDEGAAQSASAATKDEGAAQDDNESNAQAVSTGTDQTEKTEEAQDTASKKDYFCRADDYAVDCPDSLAAKLTAHYSYGNTVISYNGVQVAIISSESVHVDGSGTELRNQSYGLVPESDPSGTVRVKCRLLYVNADGKTVHWGDSSGNLLGVEELLGISADTFLSYIRIVDDAGYVGCTYSLLSDDNDTTSNSTPVTTAAQPAPFWGVWVGAFKTEGEAQAYASEWSAKGFPADVYMTTDWANLNSEPWYVVTVGSYASEGDANAVVGSAQSAGQPDAYVKYSGDYIG